jgi:glyoxylase-like metal-dependent hydrolase (beta-lactamase superfamily II)
MQTNSKKKIYTLDLNFMDIGGAIASYMIPHSDGVILVECGPGSTLDNLNAALQEHGYSPADISHVLLTHIHLDHAGAAGWLARQGATIFVHPVGAPHMMDPEKLLASAERIYGDEMDQLWGQFLPVPEERIVIPEDNEVIEIDGMQFRALDTPGHARHHYAYIFQDVCFSGDIGGVRMANSKHLRIPMPPPEFVLEDWRNSRKRLENEFLAEKFSRIAPTHFGIFTDPIWHLNALRIALDEIENWIGKVMPAQPAIEDLNSKFMEWTRQRSLADGLSETQIAAYEAANPSWMSSYGIQRYWRKHRMQE